MQTARNPALTPTVNMYRYSFENNNFMWRRSTYELGFCCGHVWHEVIWSSLSCVSMSIPLEWLNSVIFFSTYFFCNYINRFNIMGRHLTNMGYKHDCCDIIKPIWLHPPGTYRGCLSSLALMSCNASRYLLQYSIPAESSGPEDNFLSGHLNS